MNKKSQCRSLSGQQRRGEWSSTFSSGFMLRQRPMGKFPIFSCFNMPYLFKGLSKVSFRQRFHFPHSFLQCPYVFHVFLRCNGFVTTFHHFHSLLANCLGLNPTGRCSPLSFGISVVSICLAFPKFCLRNGFFTTFHHFPPIPFL